MPDGDGAAVDVDPPGSHAQFPLRRQRHRRKRLVDLDDVELINRDALAGKGFVDGVRRLVRRGDAVTRDTPHAIVAFLATATLGAICGQDYPAVGAAAGFSQLAPKVLSSSNGYVYNDHWIDKRTDITHLRALLPGQRPGIGLEDDYPIIIAGP